MRIPRALRAIRAAGRGALSAFALAPVGPLSALALTIIGSPLFAEAVWNTSRVRRLAPGAQDSTTSDGQGRAAELERRAAVTSYLLDLADEARALLDAC